MSESISRTLNITCDLDRPLGHTALGSLHYTGEQGGLALRVAVCRSGTAVDLTGAAVSGYLLRFNRETLVIPGSVSGAEACLTLPEEAYSVPGDFSLTVRVAREGTCVTVFSGDGHIRPTSSGSLLSPGRLVLGVDELLAQVGRLEQAASAAQEVLNGPSFVWTPGNISSAGGITTNPALITRSNYYSNLIRPESYTALTLSASQGRDFAVCRYDAEGSFISREGWYREADGEVTITNTHAIRLVIGFVDEHETVSSGEVLRGVSIEVEGNTVSTLRRELRAVQAAADSAAQTAARAEGQAALFAEGLAWTAAKASRYPAAPTLHLSLDDVAAPLKNLCDNAAVYASVWEEPELARLKALHEETGCVISLYCFLEADGFDISQLPAIPAWQRELQAAKGWLRFGLHAADSATNYRTAATAQEDYGRFRAGITALTGSAECIDRVPRLGYFGCSAEQVEALRLAADGPVGLLCADSEGRMSYALTEEQAAQVWRHGCLPDPAGRMVYLKTYPRLDSHTAAEVQALMTEDELRGVHQMEAFAHAPVTNAALERMRQLAVWWSGRGGRFGFAADVWGD